MIKHDGHFRTQGKCRKHEPYGLLKGILKFIHVILIGCCTPSKVNGVNKSSSRSGEYWGFTVLDDKREVWLEVYLDSFL